MLLAILSRLSRHKEREDPKRRKEKCEDDWREQMQVLFERTLDRLTSFLINLVN